MAHKSAKGRAMTRLVRAPSNPPPTPLRIGSFLLDQTRVACNRGRYEMAVKLPSQERVTGAGHTEREAFINFCTEVSGLLFPEATAEPHDADAWTAQDLELLRALVARHDDKTRVARRTKARQKTVGVNCKVSLISHVGKDQESESFARAVRELFDKGLDALDQRLEEESSIAVFEEFQSSYAKLPDSESKQWMLRLERRSYERALVLANEYGKSLSNLAAICIAYALTR